MIRLHTPNGARCFDEACQAPHVLQMPDTEYQEAILDATSDGYTMGYNAACDEWGVEVGM